MNKLFLKKEMDDVIKSQIFINEDINSLIDNHLIENKKLLSNIDNLKKDLEDRIRHIEDTLESNNITIYESLKYFNINMNEKAVNINNIICQKNKSTIESIKVKNQEQLKKLMEIQNYIDERIDNLNLRIVEAKELQEKSQENIISMLENINKNNKRRFWIMIVIFLIIFITQAV